MVEIQLNESFKNRQRKVLKEDAKIENKDSGNRKQKVCLIGDSLVGQLNVPLLGKSTNSFVRRLKAPKIQDVEQYTAETKNAKQWNKQLKEKRRDSVLYKGNC